MSDNSQPSPSTDAAPAKGLDRLALTVTPLGNGRYRVTDGSMSSLAYATMAGTTTWVYIHGRVYVIDPDDGPRAARGPHDDNWALSAPMPATVAAINVEPGQQVLQGHVMITLEAMKMELPVKAPRDGRVKALLCSRGELVQPGVPLLEME